ncbi:hypothetical protein OG741_00925 [Streptomyces sp. NBC_01410]|uniref:hypothetical protein n=1 Tax=Streptomyces sp. NBC_01410 TaxID=2903856 RepID=UPI003250E48E
MTTPPLPPVNDLISGEADHLARLSKIMHLTKHLEPTTRLQPLEPFTWVLKKTEAGLDLVATPPNFWKTQEAMAVTIVPPVVEEGASDLVHALLVQHLVPTATDASAIAGIVDSLAAKTLVVPRSERWREAVSTALLGDWSASLWTDNHLPSTAVGTLKAEARLVHRQLVPVWRRRTRHGRVLSLDAALGNGLSLYDLVATDVDLLARTAGGVFEDERLNAVLRGLDPAERLVVFAYAEGEGSTWTEAAAATGATDPAAFGKRVLRKAKRQADEQCRRAKQRRGDIEVPSSICSIRTARGCR